MVGAVAVGVSLMFPFSIYAKLAIALAVAVFIAGVSWKLHHSGIVAGRAEVQARWDKDIAERTTAALAAEQAARAKETALQVGADKLRRTKDAEITGLAVRVGELNKRLSNRADRPADSPAGAASSAGPGATGCTGAELYRADSAFLVREAERADRLRAALRQCQSQYENARALN
jgi:hypothetical protein